MFAIFSQPLFFSILGILGIEYEGIDSSPLYAIYIVVLFSLTLILYIYSSLIKGLFKSELAILVFIGLVFSYHFLGVILYSIENKLLPESLLFYILLGLPGFLSATTVIKLNLIKQCIKITEMLFIIIALGVTFYSVLPSFLGMKITSLAGASYQALSYYAAFSFGGILFYITQVPSKLRCKFVTLKLYSLLAYSLLISCAIGTILGGGRGAFLLLLFYSLLYSFRFLNIKKWASSINMLIKGVLVLLALVLCVTTLIITFSNQDFIKSGLERATQYISSDGGIDVAEGSSGRNIVYENALTYINQKPIFGYGPFNSLDTTLQAHNIFLDILLQFGIIGLLGFLIFLTFMIYRCIREWNLYISWIMILFMYPALMLMFSGYYLHNTVFIFTTTFLFMYKKKFTNLELTYP